LIGLGRGSLLFSSVANRSAQKERLRRQREQREAQDRAAQRRKLLIGYFAGGLVVLFLGAALVAFLIKSGEGESGGGGENAGDVLPGGGQTPEQKVTGLKPAAKAASCELKSYKNAKGVNDHTEDLSEEIKYATSPPTFGRHYIEPTEDGAYEAAPDEKRLVHALEHGRIVIWFKNTLSRDQRANLKALFDEDTYQMVLTPAEMKMPYAIAATAWNGDPRPGGTGRLLGCDQYNPRIFDAIRTFKDEHRSNGPEAVP